MVRYENLTFMDGDHVELTEEKKQFLEERGHEVVVSNIAGAMVQLIVQNFKDTIDAGRKGGKIPNNQTLFGLLTAVSDPRKNGFPAAV